MSRRGPFFFVVFLVFVLHFVSFSYSETSWIDSVSVRNGVSYGGLNYAGPNSKVEIVFEDSISENQFNLGWAYNAMGESIYLKDLPLSSSSKCSLNSCVIPIVDFEFYRSSESGSFDLELFNEGAFQTYVKSIYIDSKAPNENGASFKYWFDRVDTGDLILEFSNLDEHDISVFDSISDISSYVRFHSETALNNRPCYVFGSNSIRCPISDYSNLENKKTVFDVTFSDRLGNEKVSKDFVINLENNIAFDIFPTDSLSLGENNLYVSVSSSEKEISSFSVNSRCFDSPFSFSCDSFSCTAEMSFNYPLSHIQSSCLAEITALTANNEEYVSEMFNLELEKDEPGVVSQNVEFAGDYPSSPSTDLDDFWLDSNFSTVYSDLSNSEDFLNLSLKLQADEVVSDLKLEGDCVVGSYESLCVDKSCEVSFILNSSYFFSDSDNKFLFFNNLNGCEINYSLYDRNYNAYKSASFSIYDFFDAPNVTYDESYTNDFHFYNANLLNNFVWINLTGDASNHIDYAYLKGNCSPDVLFLENELEDKTNFSSSVLLNISETNDVSVTKCGFNVFGVNELMGIDNFPGDLESYSNSLEKDLIPPKIFDGYYGLSRNNQICENSLGDDFIYKINATEPLSNFTISRFNLSNDCFDFGESKTFECNDDTYCAGGFNFKETHFSDLETCYYNLSFCDVNGNCNNSLTKDLISFDVKASEFDLGEDFRLVYDLQTQTTRLRFYDPNFISSLEIEKPDGSSSDFSGECIRSFSGGYCDIDLNTIYDDVQAGIHTLNITSRQDECGNLNETKVVFSVILDDYTPKFADKEGNVIDRSPFAYVQDSVSSLDYLRTDSNAHFYFYFLDYLTEGYIVKINFSELFENQASNEIILNSEDNCYFEKTSDELNMGGLSLIRCGIDQNLQDLGVSPGLKNISVEINDSTGLVNSTWNEIQVNELSSENSMGEDGLIESSVNYDEVALPRSFLNTIENYPLSYAIKFQSTNDEKFKFYNFRLKNCISSSVEQGEYGDVVSAMNFDFASDFSNTQDVFVSSFLNYSNRIDESVDFLDLNCTFFVSFSEPISDAEIQEYEMAFREEEFDVNLTIPLMDLKLPAEVALEKVYTETCDSNMNKITANLNDVYKGMMVFERTCKLPETFISMGSTVLTPLIELLSTVQTLLSFIGVHVDLASFAEGAKDGIYSISEQIDLVMKPACNLVECPKCDAKYRDGLFQNLIFGENEDTMPTCEQSLLVSLDAGCLPKIYEHMMQYSEISCDYGKCMINSIYSDDPDYDFGGHCDAIRQKDNCEFWVKKLGNVGFVRSFMDLSGGLSSLLGSYDDLGSKLASSTSKIISNGICSGLGNFGNIIGCERLEDSESWLGISGATKYREGLSAFHSFVSKTSIFVDLITGGNVMDAIGDFIGWDSLESQFDYATGGFFSDGENMWENLDNQYSCNYFYDEDFNFTDIDVDLSITPFNSIGNASLCDYISYELKKDDFLPSDDEENGGDE